MAGISAADVKALRDQTGAGMMDCKRALSEAEGDLKRANELLRERGQAKAGKREGRATSEGVIATVIDGSVGAMVEVGCETDFVARTDNFIAIGEKLAGAVAADASLTSADALLEASVDGKKVADLVTEAIATLGENVVVKKVARIDVGGVVGGYVHAGGKLGVIVGLATADSGADALAKDVAMHIAAADPTPSAVTRDAVASDLLDSERAIYAAQAKQEGKPEKVIEKIVEGKINKYLSQICLVEQPFVKDPDQSVGAILGEATVTAFHRFKLGEAINQ
ncbi:MAG: elongation factor Ts [Deltaproteobacteria bacterium]|nr:elongation factor Ts [Deltaproteobacteria bacterium]MBW2397892.1 elongation factor Ts [Deltaproteobacteria bacterium]MBW2668164.1 elongation factor Ts [Deltaproteobacteria bacterium]